MVEKPLYNSVLKSKAYARRNATWGSNFWDTTEWEECIEEAKKEIK